MDSDGYNKADRYDLFPVWKIKSISNSFLKLMKPT